MADSELANLLQKARRVLVFTGAGISTGSGIPDYRGPQGVWKTERPVLFQDFMASGEARARYWAQKARDWKRFRDATPNATHRAVAALERLARLEAVVTQNIDGLHARAGTSRARLVELHGTNREVACMTCDARSEPQAHFDAFEASGEPPLCGCGGYLKPATISFGQSLRARDLERAAEAAAACDLVIAMGSTLSVYPACEIPLRAAQRGVPYVVINRGPTDHDALEAVTLRLEGDVAELLPPAVALIDR